MTIPMMIYGVVMALLVAGAAHFLDGYWCVSRVETN